MSALTEGDYSRFWCTNANFFCVNLRTSDKVYEKNVCGQPTSIIAHYFKYYL